MKPEAVHRKTGRHMNRIEGRFAKLKQENKKGFIVYIGAGDPDLDKTRELALGFDKLGVDILELGVPFSDPLADGVVNQLAAQRGLNSGTTPAKVLETVARIRRDSQIPVVLYIYFNLVHRYGIQTFIADAAKAGVDGLLVLDLPPEESEGYEFMMDAAGLSNIYLVAPTTPAERVSFIVKRARGFVYCVSREGVTGMRDTMAGSVGELTAEIRRHTPLPIAIGFGISTAKHARSAAQLGDAVVVGSAIVNQVAKGGQAPDMIQKVMAFTAELVAATKEV